jgi:hypothetical protein
VVIVHVANQVNVPADANPRYEWSGRTIEHHRAQIREFLGFREATVQDGTSCHSSHSLSRQDRRTRGLATDQPPS